MRNSESVAVHVRRGDYVTNPDAQKIYRNLDAAYYRRCLEDLARNADSLCVYLFSDDIDWCLKNLEIGRPLIPVVHNDASMAYEDLQLMRYCRHAIIANSSFSWWGAYLGEDHAQRRVYYPDPWFNNGVLNDKWIGCAGWINEKTLHGHDE